MQNSSILSNKRLLITGGAGFIGSNLIEKFIQQNNYIVCLDNLLTGNIKNIKPFLGNKNFKFIEGNITNLQTCEAACKGIEIILHQAALGSVARSIKEPQKTHETNSSGFLNMLVAARNNNIQRFVYASSSSVYGDANYTPKIEEKIGQALSPYAITKYTNELYAKNFGYLYGLETIGLRYFNVFGKNQNPDGEYAAVFPKFIKIITNKEKPTIFGDGSQSRDFTYIENVVIANELAATTQNRNAISNVFNIGYGETNTLLFLTNKIIEIISQYMPEVKNLEPNFGSQRLGDIKNSCASIKKAQEFLNYNPEINVIEGLNKYIAEFFI